MASVPRWRILGCVPAPEADGGNVSSALLDLASYETQPPSIQVTVLTNPSLDEFKDAVSVHRPNVVYSCGPSSSISTTQPSLIGPFRFRDAPHAPEEHLLAALSEAGVELAYLDAAVSPHFGPSLHHRGISHAVVWPHHVPIPGPVAALFTSTFFAFLASCGASPPEAFAAASHGCQALCARTSSSGVGDGGGGGGSPTLATPGPAPPLPAFVSASRPTLPDSSSIPPPDLAGLPGIHPTALTSFPGWSDVRLLAPRAELRLLLCGDCGLIDPVRLGALGEALRGLLVMEARGLTLLSSTPLPRVPRNLPAGCQAVRCSYRSTSGAAGCVVLGAPSGVLAHQGLVQHALRMTLVADSVSLQFRLPPPGLSLPAPRSSPSVAGGTLLVDSVAATSVWAVQVLRALCKETRHRGLSSLGVAAVGCVADGSFTAADIARLQHIITGGPKLLAPDEPAAVATSSEPLGPAGQPTAAGGVQDTAPSPAAPGGGAVDGPDLASVAARGGAYFGNDAHMGYAAAGQLQYLTGVEDGTAGDASPDGASEGPYDGFTDGGVGDGASPDGASAGVAHRSMGGRQSVPPCDKRPSFTGDLPGYTCRRPPLSVCTESQFYDDLVEFQILLRGKPIDRSRFPEAVLNGVALDLWALYREVVTRGGFRVGNGINWKGQVFPRMRNWTETNKQTGVGNALKRHYQNYLWEYEMAHPDDVTLDRCVLCNGGDGVASDWVCCDACENWAHFSCDKRPGLGAFKDYAQGQGRVYTCPSCAREQEAEEAVKRQRTA